MNWYQRPEPLPGCSGECFAGPDGFFFQEDGAGVGEWHIYKLQAGRYYRGAAIASGVGPQPFEAAVRLAPTFMPTLDKSIADGTASHLG